MKPVELNIKFTLEDGDYCNGCPCLHYHDESDSYYCKYNMNNVSHNARETKIIRPDQCKETLKEER